MLPKEEKQKYNIQCDQFLINKMDNNVK